MGLLTIPISNSALMRRILLLTLLGLSVAGQAAEGQQLRWSKTLERIASGVVSIRVDGTRAFDTEWNQSTQATGFVVDAKQGLILTNRHVVTPGPVVAQAVFLNQEEVDLVPVYRDPVHDFGFFRYDPKALKFIQPTELELVPEAAQIGRDIRVIGNDAGERLSILAGTIARLDRAAPDYGRGKYNDFNTFYLQAASSTSGGSSGSPVIDIEGRVVALNAGANSGAASSFFLPLDRVQRAFDQVRVGAAVSRGTLQTMFVHQPYAELRRLGLKEATERAVRQAFPDQTGMLVVKSVIPGSAAAGFFEPGDILVQVGDQLITEFVPLAAVMDDNVGKPLMFEIQRGGATLRQDLTVDDLHNITPAEFVQFGDAVVHDLSYQQARHFNRSLRGVYVANPGYVLGTAAIPRGSVITALDGKAMEDLDDLEMALAAIADGQRASVRFISFDDPQNEKLRIITIDRSWFPSQRCQRDDHSGYWPCRDLAAGPAPKPPVPRSTSFTPSSDRRADRVAPSLVLVNFDMPYTVSGVSEKHYHGTGVIADAELGWVVVDRNTVPVAMGDVRLTFAGSLEIPGHVVFIHPLHNLAVVGYDPALIGATPVRSADFVDRRLKPGDELWVIGLKGDSKLQMQSTAVASVSAANFALSRTLRFRDANLETVAVVNAPSDYDGVLVDSRGGVVSLWSSFAVENGRDMEQVNMGVPAELVTEMIDRLRDGEPLHSLEVEWRQMPVASARKLDLPEHWVKRYEEHNPERRQMLAVMRVVAGSPAAEFFQPGDLLLSIDGEVLNTFREVERASQKDRVNVHIFRDGAELVEDLETAALGGRGIDRAVLWAGALVQEPHRALAVQRGIEPTGVYVSYFGYGSPATRYGLFAGRRVVEVDGQPTPDLDAFLAVVRDKGDRESLRIKTVTWNNMVEVITLTLDEQYWPAYELLRSGNGWRRVTLN